MNWQEKLTNQMALVEPVHYIVNDPDNLCFEPVIADLIEQAGAVLFSDIDPIALRLCFEEWLDSDERSVLLIRVVDEQPSIP